MEYRSDSASGDELGEDRAAVCERPESRGAPWVEVLDRGQDAHPRYAVTSSALCMAGATDDFIAGMEFASRIARVLNCGSMLRRI